MRMFSAVRRCRVHPPARVVVAARAVIRWSRAQILVPRRSQQSSQRGVNVRVLRQLSLTTTISNDVS